MQSHDKSFGGLGALLTDTPHAQTEPYTIYFAGGLFDHKELFGNAKLAEYIERVSRGKYVCVLPQDLEQTDNRAAEVRNQDLLQVMKNDLAIFNFDGTELDSGTVVEMVFGKMLDIPAVVLRTDFRNAGDGAKDGDPWNLMCSAYPRNKVLLVHSMAWYQEALRQGGTTAEVEERLYTRMATAVIEQLDAVIQQKGWLTDEVNVQEIYKAALLFPGSGLEKTPDSFLRSIIRRKTAKGLLPKESDANNLIPRKAQRLHLMYRELLRLSRDLQAGATPAGELVLSGTTISRCDELMEAVLNLDRFMGESLTVVAELYSQSDAAHAAGPIAQIATAARDRAATLRTRAETVYRETTFNSRAVFHLPQVAAQEAALRQFTLEAQDVANTIAEQAEAKAADVTATY